MAGMPDGLVAFLRDCLDEDEAAARRAPDARWFVPEWDDSSVYLSGTGAAPLLRGIAGSTAAAHAAQHQPTRVLAEVEAKRRIVRLHTPHLVETIDPDGQEHHGWFCDRDDDEWPCADLRALAAPCADRPGYQQEWRP